MLAPDSTQQQGKTHNRGTCRYSVQRGTTDSSVRKTAGDKWPAPARRLTRTRLGATVYLVENKRQNPDLSPIAKSWCARVQCVSFLASLGLGRTSIQDELIRKLRTNNL